jgi:hypothetical protein
MVNMGIIRLTPHHQLIQKYGLVLCLFMTNLVSMRFHVHIDVVYSLPHSGLLWITTKERKVWRYQRGNQNSYIEEGHNTMAKRKNYKRTNNDLQNTTQKSKDWTTRTQLKTSLILLIYLTYNIWIQQLLITPLISSNFSKRTNNVWS